MLLQQCCRSHAVTKTLLNQLFWEVSVQMAHTIYHNLVKANGRRFAFIMRELY
jgi:hypothetical protein